MSNPFQMLSKKLLRLRFGIIGLVFAINLNIILLLLALSRKPTGGQIILTIIMGIAFAHQGNQLWKLNKEEKKFKVPQ